MFSVIIPLYNKSLYIERTITSVIEQSFVDFEIIVVNDGSTDDSVSKVEAIKDSRIRIIHQENAGVSNARNRGSLEARYNYLAFLDGDDWWAKDFLYEMNLMIQKFSDAAVYGSNYYLVKNGVNKVANVGINDSFTKGYINYFEVYAKTFCVPLNCSFVVVNKNSFFRIGEFNTNLKFAEDLDLWIRLSLNFKVAYLNKRLAFSNQDVAVGNRALGNKLWKKEEHFIFNADYLKEQEERNSALKTFMDGLRLRALLRYYLNGVYVDEVNGYLKEVNFKIQPHYYKFVYRFPLPVVKLVLLLKSKGSAIKQYLIRNKLW